MITKPFIHKFRTDRSQYIYDVTSNSIIQVNDLEAELADTFEPESPDSAIAAFSSRFGSESVCRAWTHIKAYADRCGVLSGKRPSGLAPPLCEEHMREELDGKLRQLILNVTEQCNLRCRYCTYSGNYAHERRHNNRHMSISVAEKALRIFLAQSGKSERVSVSFYGGEPLLNLAVIRHVIDLAESTCGCRHCSFFIDTNATLLSPALIDYLRSHKAFIQISIDGPQQIHDKYRVYEGGRPTFNVVLSALRALYDLDREYFKTHVTLAVTIAPPYDLIRILEYFDSSKMIPDVLKVGFVNRQGCDFEAIFAEALADSHLESDWQELRRRYIDEKSRDSCDVRSPVLRDFFMKPLLRIHRRESGLVRDLEHANGACVPGQRRLFVSVDGDFYMCEKIGSSGKIGDVHTGLNKAAIRRIMEDYVALSQDDCCNCWAVRLCSLCYTSALHQDQLDLARKRQYCEGERYSLDEALVMYAEIMERNDRAFDFVSTMIFDD